MFRNSRSGHSHKNTNETEYRLQYLDFGTRETYRHSLLSEMESHVFTLYKKMETSHNSLIQCFIKFNTRYNINRISLMHEFT